MDMDMELICLIICFLVGTILFYLLRSNCGCNVVEGNTEGDNNSFGCCMSTGYTDNPDPPSPSTDSSCDHNEHICKNIFNCSNTGSITDHNNTTKRYDDFNCEQYCGSDPEWDANREKCVVEMDCKGGLARRRTRHV